MDAMLLAGDALMSCDVFELKCTNDVWNQMWLNLFAVFPGWSDYTPDEGIICEFIFGGLDLRLLVTGRIQVSQLAI